MSNSHVATTYVKKVTHTYVLLVSLSAKISLRFSLRPAVFELQAILRQVHWMTHKMILNTTTCTGSKLCVTNIIMCTVRYTNQKMHRMGRHRIPISRRCQLWNTMACRRGQGCGRNSAPRQDHLRGSSLGWSKLAGWGSVGPSVDIADRW